MAQFTSHRPSGQPATHISTHMYRVHIIISTCTLALSHVGQTAGLAGLGTLHGAVHVPPAVRTACNTRRYTHLCIYGYTHCTKIYVYTCIVSCRPDSRTGRTGDIASHKSCHINHVPPIIWTACLTQKSGFKYAYIFICRYHTHICVYTCTVPCGPDSRSEDIA